MSQDHTPTTIRDVEWCEAELRAGRAICGERIHLTRPIVAPNANFSPAITGCIISQDFEGYFGAWEAPEVVAMFDEHGFRPGHKFQH